MGSKKDGQANDSGVIIREARSGDQAGVFGLYAELAEAYGSSPEADTAQQEKLWLELSQADRQTLLVAEADGQVIGTLTLIVIPNLGHGGRPWAAIENVVVATAYQGRGIGKALMSTAGEIAAENGCYKIILSSNQAREKAHEFYRNLGWEQTHIGFSITLR